MSDVGLTPLEALQATLAAEHAAVYVYGVLGGRISSSASPDAALRLREAYQAHRGRRDQVRSMVADLGEVPVASSPAYDVEARSRDTGELSRIAAETEDRCAEVYAQLVASVSGDQRAWAVEALVDSAVRRLGFAPGHDAFPGLPEL